MANLIAGFLPLICGVVFIGAVLAKHNAWGAIAFYGVFVAVLLVMTFRLV